MHSIEDQLMGQLAREIRKEWQERLLPLKSS